MIHEDDLGAHLGEGGKPATLVAWETARRRLVHPLPPRPGRYVALLRIEGTIIDGHSRRSLFKPPVPLLFDDRVGDLTVVRQARQLQADRRAAAVVVYINSPGGSATASEAIASALQKLAAIKPVVVTMGPVAGSGGYYVATPARWIVAQPSTVTGSIGVVHGKLVSGGLLDKLLFHHETVSRGNSALLLDSAESFTPAQLQAVWAGIRRIYAVFVERVAASRKMTPEQVDAIGGGRVFSGRQALERGLVDELGGPEQALAKARELAGLSAHVPLREVGVVPRSVAPAAAPTTNLVHDVILGLRELCGAGPQTLCPLLWDSPPLVSIDNSTTIQS